ncbi:MAG: hypothetical protein H6Q16_1865 [Bacteroidetes bacterium]|nr:hypothetical protein [Bacteroidota bacterium]
MRIFHPKRRASFGIKDVHLLFQQNFWEKDEWKLKELSFITFKVQIYKIFSNLSIKKEVNIY